VPHGANFFLSLKFFYSQRMDTLSGKVAVVTGAASGIGRGMALTFAKAGANLVLSDIDEGRLVGVVNEASAFGVSAIGVAANVADEASMNNLAAKAFERFEQVHVVCNNAGVAGSSLSGLAIDVTDWKWVLDVNLWGVIHGHRVFLPHMLANGEGHIVNTSSMAGHLPGHSAYGASKFAVAGISEGLFHELAAINKGVSVSCLCPGWVNTNIADSMANRPEWVSPRAELEADPEREARAAMVRDFLRGGMDPLKVGELVLDAIVNKRFWVFTDLEMVGRTIDRHRAIEENRNPVRLPFG
jgi:NAD(P)-dependent dehydrogenase (short-subunit alcohol dehydrogenase family)